MSLGTRQFAIENRRYGLLFSDYSGMQNKDYYFAFSIYKLVNVHLLEPFSG